MVKNRQTRKIVKHKLSNCFQEFNKAYILYTSLIIITPSLIFCIDKMQPFFREGGIILACCPKLKKVNFNQTGVGLEILFFTEQGQVPSCPKLFFRQKLQVHTKITLYLRDGVLDFGMLFFCFGKKFRSGVIIGGIKGIRLVCFFRKLTAGEIFSSKFSK